MATNYFKAIHSHHHHHRSLRRRHSIDCPPSASSFFLKPTTTTKTSTATTTTASNYLPNSIFASNFSLSSTTTSSSILTSNTNISFDVLQKHLSAKNFRQADEETRRLLIVLAGEAAQKRGYVFFSEVQFISESDLKTIDELWRKYSDERFGYSVQKKIWKKMGKDFTKFFLKVGWMKKLDTEIEQYNYRSFPDEFNWELNEETPQGHLPLTNALRGIQLLNNILSHPAFEGDDEEEEESEDENGGLVKSGGLSAADKSLSKSRVFKPDYSF